MPNIANLLKAEISRIARKEVRAEVQTLRKASVQYRTEIAALKRVVAEQQRSLAKLMKQGQSAKAPIEKGESSSLRFRAEGFASLRKKLNLSAAEMGKLLNVSQQSVYKWESGKAKPRASQLARIAKVRTLGKRAVAEMLAK